MVLPDCCLQMFQVFQYLVDTAADKQTRESVSDLLGKVKKYDLAKAEVLNIINLSPTLPVGIYTVSLSQSISGPFDLYQSLSVVNKLILRYSFEVKW